MRKYFKVDTKRHQVIFTGESLEVYVPERYDKYGMLTIGKAITTVGVFDMVINGSIRTGSMLPALLRMEPSSVDTKTAGTDTVYVLTFAKGDVFSQTQIIKNASLAYALFNEIIFLGRIPEFLTYERIPQLFDMMEDVCGVNFHTEHAIYEIIAAFLTRAKKDTSIQARLQPSSAASVFVALKNVSTLATTTTSKLLGSYFDATSTAALVNQSSETTDYEQILVT